MSGVCYKTMDGLQSSHIGLLETCKNNPLLLNVHGLGGAHKETFYCFTS